MTPWITLLIYLSNLKHVIFNTPFRRTRTYHIVFCDQVKKGMDGKDPRRVFLIDN